MQLYVTGIHICSFWTCTSVTEDYCKQCKLKVHTFKG